MIIGDLNLDRLRPDKREGKLLLDLEIEQGFTCLISNLPELNVREQEFKRVDGPARLV